jgi:hypothetical protein
MQSNTALATISIPSLSTVLGDLSIDTNAVLATISLPSLSIVIEILSIRFNPSLTLASFPQLTFIGEKIHICANNAAFRIPNGPPDAPTGGLVITGPSKGTINCSLQEGNATCISVICP